MLKCHISTRSCSLRQASPHRCTCFVTVLTHCTHQHASSTYTHTVANRLTSLRAHTERVIAPKRKTAVMAATTTKKLKKVMTSSIEKEMTRRAGNVLPFKVRFADTHCQSWPDMSHWPFHAFFQPWHVPLGSAFSPLFIHLGCGCDVI